MPKVHNKILKYNQEQKSIKLPFVIYSKIESLLEKMHTCGSNKKKIFISEMKNYICGYPLFMHCLFDTTKILYEKVLSRSKRVHSRSNKL